MSDEKLIRRLSKVLYERQDAKSNELSTLESNETKLKNKIDNLMTALEDVDVAVGMIRDRLANLKAELDKTQEEIIRLKSKNPRVTLEQIEYLLRAEENLLQGCHARRKAKDHQPFRQFRLRLQEQYDDRLLQLPEREGEGHLQRPVFKCNLR